MFDTSHQKQLNHDAAPEPEFLIPEEHPYYELSGNFFVIFDVDRPEQRETQIKNAGKEIIDKLRKLMPEEFATAEATVPSVVRRRSNGFGKFMAAVKSNDFGAAQVIINETLSHDFLAQQRIAGDAIMNLYRKYLELGGKPQ